MGKFENDLSVAIPLLRYARSHNGELPMEERKQLVNVLGVSYHKDGKIQGIWSIDSCASLCGFCQKMRKAAMGNPDHICGYCYACKGRMIWSNIKNRHELNMTILSSVNFCAYDFENLIHGTVRFDADGDFNNNLHAENAFKIAVGNPGFRHTLWSKNYRAVQAAIHTVGNPENLTKIASSPIIGKAIKLPKGFDYVFTVYRTEAEVLEAIRNGGCPCNGRKCMDCRYSCYTGAWQKGSNIAELLRLK